MQTKNIYIQQLIHCLSPLHPYLVILFGSYASGNSTNDSDIDILVVTNDDFSPKDFKEHTDVYLKVSKAIRPIKKQIAVDLIVHTKSMYKHFLKQNSIFGNEIISKGKIIYEGNHSRMA